MKGDETHKHYEFNILFNIWIEKDLKSDKKNVYLYNSLKKCTQYVMGLQEKQQNIF